MSVCAPTYSKIYGHNDAPGICDGRVSVATAAENLSHLRNPRGSNCSTPRKLVKVVACLRLLLLLLPPLLLLPLLLLLLLLLLPVQMLLLLLLFAAAAAAAALPLLLLLLLLTAAS